VLAGDDLLAGVSEVCEGLVLDHDGGAVCVVLFECWGIGFSEKKD
jgi:hypothetical protein